jgi:hypothetical protein
MKTSNAATGENYGLQGSNPYRGLLAAIGRQQTERRSVMSIMEWIDDRVRLLREDGASESMIRGFMDASHGLLPDTDDLAGEPFELDDYYSGFSIGEYSGVAAAA